MNIDKQNKLIYPGKKSCARLACDLQEEGHSVSWKNYLALYLPLGCACSDFDTQSYESPVCRFYVTVVLNDYYVAMICL